MGRFSFLFLLISAWLAASLPALAQEASAQATVAPQDILDAHAEAARQAMYVCPRSALKKIDADLLRLTDEIRQRFQPDFATKMDAPIVTPAICPSPHSFPDFPARIERYAKAVEDLEQVLRRH